MKLTRGIREQTHILEIAHHASKRKEEKEKCDHPSPNRSSKWILLFHCLQSTAGAGNGLQQLRLRHFKSRLFLKWEAGALFEITQMSSVMMPLREQRKVRTTVSHVS